MAKSTVSHQPGRPGRKPSLIASHIAALRAIVHEQPRASLDEVTQELLRCTGVMVNPVTVRKALRETGIERLMPLRRAGVRAPTQGTAPQRYGYTDAHRRSDGPSGMNTDLTDAE
jgi:transposase